MTLKDVHKYLKIKRSCKINLQEFSKGIRTTQNIQKITRDK